MEIKNERFTRKVGGNDTSFQITLPRIWKEQYGLKKGFFVTLILEEVVNPKELKK